MPIKSAAAIAVAVVAGHLVAADFSFTQNGLGPLSGSYELSYEGGGERLTATATNNTRFALPLVRLCLPDAGSPDGCLFVLWNQSPWKPGVTLNWNLTTTKRIADLHRTLSLLWMSDPRTDTEPGGPSVQKATASSPLMMAPVPTSSQRPTAPSSAPTPETVAPAPRSSANTLSNESVVQLVKAGVGEDVILTMINSQSGTYAVDAQSVITAKQAGVPDKVLAAMIAKASMPGVAAATALPSQMPGQAAPSRGTEPFASGPLPTSPKIAKLPNLQLGTVLDSVSSKTWVPTGSTSQASVSGNAYGSDGFAHVNASGWSATQVHSMTINEKQLMILTEDFIYLVNDAVEKAVGFDLHGAVGRAIANHKHGCHVIINGLVQFSPDKGYLNVVDVDGKICHMEIARQERTTK